MKRLQIIMLLMSILLYFAPAMAQDVTIQKPKLKEQTQTAPATKSTTSVSEPTGYINGHGYVDLGLSVKWATCNVGASSPSDYGDYYAWAEKKTKSEYTMENSVTSSESIGEIAGNPKYDVARTKWGSTWRLPTREDIEELIDMCKYTWTTQGGHKGYKITGPNNNSIFLPAAGYRANTSLDQTGTRGYYWSGMFGDDTGDKGIMLDFDKDEFGWHWTLAGYGQSVRPVSE